MAIDDEPEEPDYPRYRVRRALVRGVALLLVLAMLLAFPLAYILDAELRSQRTAGALFVIEIVLALVIGFFVRGGRRRG